MFTGVKVTGCDEYFTDMQQRMINPRGMGVTLTGKVWKIKGYGWVVKAEPNIPEFWKYGLVTLVGSYFLFDIIGMWGLIAFIPSLIMIPTGLFWSRPFYEFIIKKGLNKKYGKRNRHIVFVHGENLLELVLNGTA